MNISSEKIQLLKESIVKDDVDKIDEISESILAFIELASESIDNSMASAKRLLKFKNLIENGKLIGIDDINIQNEELRLTESKIFNDALRTIQGISFRVHKTRSNENDAHAISFIHYLNKKFADSDKVFMSFSSASSTHDIIKHLNSSLLFDKGKNIQVRDINYINLWFSLALRSTTGKPRKKDIIDLRKRIRPLILDLKMKCNKFINLLDDALFFPFKNNKNQLKDKVENYIAHFEHTIKDIFRPLFDARGVLSLVAMEFSPYSETSNLDKVIKDIFNILNRIREILPSGFEVIKVELEELLIELEALLRDFQVKYSELFFQMISKMEDKFFRGLIVGEWEFEEDYSNILYLYDQNYVSLKAAFEMLEDIHQKKKCVFEYRIIKSRLNLPENSVQANKELEFIESQNKHPEFLLTQSLISRANGFFNDEEDILLFLCESYDNALIRLHFSQMYFRKYKVTRERIDLDRAVENSTLAFQKSKYSHANLRVECLVDFFHLTKVSGKVHNLFWKNETILELESLLKISNDEPYSLGLTSKIVYLLKNLKTDN